MDRFLRELSMFCNSMLFISMNNMQSLCNLLSCTIHSITAAVIDNQNIHHDNIAPILYSKILGLCLNELYNKHTLVSHIIPHLIIYLVSENDV
jgi:hypothetical protein